MTWQQLVALAEKDADQIKTEIVTDEEKVAPYLAILETFIPSVKTTIDADITALNAKVDELLGNLPPELKTYVDAWLAAVEKLIE